MVDSLIRCDSESLLFSIIRHVSQFRLHLGSQEIELISGSLIILSSTLTNSDADAEKSAKDALRTHLTSKTFPAVLGNTNSD